MQTKVFILCRSKDNLIGANGNLPWKIPSDLRRFKRITLNNFVLFGRKTYESLPNKTLKDRKLLILTQNQAYKPSDQKSHFCAQIQLNGEIFSKSVDLKNETIYIGGGSEIYELFLRSEPLHPDIIVDSVVQNYEHATNIHHATYLSENFNKILESLYMKREINIVDDVITQIWIKKTPLIHNLLNKIEYDGITSGF